RTLSGKLPTAQKAGQGGPLLIWIGEGHPRSLSLPTIGVVRLHDDTRMLRRLLRPVGHLDPDTRQPVAPRAKVLFATVSRHGSRWYVSLNVQAPDFHAQRRHPPHPADDSGGLWGWTAPSLCSGWRPPGMGARSDDSRRPSRCRGG